MSKNYISIESHFTLQSGFAFPSSSFIDDGIPIVRMSDLKSGRLRFENTKYVSPNWSKIAAIFLLKENDFLVGMSGSLSNYAAVATEDIPALLNQRVGRLLCKSDRQSYEYVCYWLKSIFYHRYAEIQGEGAAQKNISSKQIGLFRYRDIPLVEQCEIVKILQTIDRTIAHTKALIEKYQQIKTGLMHDLFTRGIGADGKLRPPCDQAPELYQESAIGWIPKVWETFQISELAAPFKGSTVIGPFGSNLVMTDYRSEGTPVIFVRDAKEDQFNWISDVFISSQKTRMLFAHRVSGGDLLATKMGLPPCISCIYPEGMPMGIVTADMIRMTVDISKVNPSWLSASINHDRVKRQVAAITAGVTRPKVTLGDFRSLKIATPSLEEQLAVNSILNRQRQLILSEENTLLKLQKQKSGLMHDLLTGKVPVNVDLEEVAHV